MKNTASLAFLLLISVCTVAGQTKPPGFGKYRVAVEKRKNVKVDLSTRDARMYRTNLRNAAKKGVNFAGHFIVATWGCGTNCSESGVIDARTGRAYFPAELAGAGFGFCDLPDETEPLVYKPDSRLVVLSGYKGGELEKRNSRCGVYYLEWMGTRFSQVRFIQKKRLQP